MAENLAYLPEVSKPTEGSMWDAFYYVFDYYGNSSSAATFNPNYINFGVLYNWEAAKIACPNGWHLPSDEEWKILEKYMGMNETNLDDIGWRISGKVGKKLKSKIGWLNDGDGIDSVGFRALAGGARNGGFHSPGMYAKFWLSSPSGLFTNCSRTISSFKDGVHRSYEYRDWGFSVRCLKDD